MAVVQHPVGQICRTQLQWICLGMHCEQLMQEARTAVLGMEWKL